MLIKKGKRKRFDNGGTAYTYDAYGQPINPLNNPKNNQMDQNLTGIASAVPGYGPLYGALAKVGIAGSNAITGKGTDVTHNIFGNLANPWNQFKDNRSTGEWAHSFLDPLGSSILKGKRLKSDVDTYNWRMGQLRNRDQMLASGNAIQGWDSQGSDTNSLYNAKYGGTILLTKKANGGEIKSLSTNNFEVNGPSHEQGGVDAFGVELEGGETGAGNFIFSEELGFAQRHKPLARAIGKIEKKPINTVTKNTLTLLKQKEQALAQEQESLKEVLGLGESAASYMN